MGTSGKNWGKKEKERWVSFFCNPVDYADRLKNADVDELERLMFRVATCDSLEEILAD